jgi:signal transduction histidine kinase
MKIKTKTIIVIFFLSLIIFGALHLTASSIIVPSYQEIERQESEKSINQVLSVINYRLSELEGIVRDYSAWDEAYDYIQTLNQKFTEENFGTAFENFNLNLIAVVNANNNLVYCQTYDSAKSSMIPTSQETITQLQSNNRIWAFESTNHLISGIMLLDDQPVLVATAPILRSSEEGPIRGGMLFGRQLSAQETSRLSEIMGLNFTLHTLEKFSLQKDGIAIVESLTSNSKGVLIKEESSNTISGYTIVEDIHSNPLFIMQISQDRVAYQHGVWTRNVFIAATFSITAVFAIGVLLLLESQIVKPMTNLAAYVKGFFLEPTAAEQHPRFGTDEVEVLANVLKDSVKQKLETMNEVSRMVAHDLRNPLTGIKGATYALKKNYGEALGEKGEDLLKLINDCVDYSDKIVTDLWEYSSEIKLDKIKASPSKLVKNALSTLIVPEKIHVANEAGKENLLMVDTGKIERVFSNLIKNAFDAMPNGGTLLITSKKAKGEVEIDFIDTGVGMSDEIIKQLGKPFFTTKAKGMGVGLSICRRIIESHGGRIEVRSIKGEGTCFAVFLPTQ